jgi:hypothetical protein
MVLLLMMYYILLEVLINVLALWRCFYAYVVWRGRAAKGRFYKKVLQQKAKRSKSACTGRRYARVRMGACCAV